MRLNFLYDLSVFAIAFWGFTAVLLTGQFSIPVLAVGYGLLFIALYLRNKIKPSPLFWNFATIAAFILALLLARRNLLDATVYFFLYLQIAKLFTRLRISDTLWVYVIAFFQVVGAAVLTSSVGFAVVFLVYVGLMTASLILFTLTREQDYTRKFGEQILARYDLAQPSRNPSRETRRILEGFLYSSGLITFFIIATSFGFFLLIPRLHTQQLFQTVGAQRGELQSSAFDETIEFGAFEKIQLDNSVAMYVRPLDSIRPDYVRLRGVAVDMFDGYRWRRSAPSTELREYSPLFHFMPFTAEGPGVHQRFTIIQPPGVTNFLFAPTFPEQIRFETDQRVLYDELSGAAAMPIPLQKEFHYTASSRIEAFELRDDPEKTRQQDENETSVALALVSPDIPIRGRVFGREYYQEYLRRCLQLPETVDVQRIRGLAEDVARRAKSRFEKSRAIEMHLRQNYGYTLEPKPGKDYVESFLFRTKEGHCEYFATGMVVMLRTIGIPARVVNGFYSVEFNEIAQAFTVRQRDAHSWVEVYFDDYGWMTFDPTPAAGVGRPVETSAFMMVYDRFMDAIKVRWYRYVVDYSFTDQLGIIRAALGAFREASAFVTSQTSYDWERGERTNLHGAARGVIIGVGSAIIAAVGVFAWATISKLRFHRRTRRRYASSMVRFYTEILRLLARRGYRRDVAETPREFAIKVAADPQLQPFSDITELYYLNRFSHQPLAPDQESAVEEFIRSIRRPPSTRP